MLTDWKDFIRKSGTGLRESGRLSPGTMKGYLALHDTGKETRRLDEKTRELISLAVAVTIRCDGCIADHPRNVIRLGYQRNSLLRR